MKQASRLVDNDAIISILIEAGADIHARSVPGASTALHSAHGLNTTLALLNAGADIHARDANGLTPLHMFCEAAVTKVLIEHGADVNARDNWGRTPLHALTDWGLMNGQDYSQNCIYLIDAGSDIAIKNNEGKTVYETALEQEDNPGSGAIIQAIEAQCSRDTLNADDTLTRIKDSKPDTPKKRGPL